jgi:hypothetical protein
MIHQLYDIISIYVTGSLLLPFKKEESMTDKQIAKQNMLQVVIHTLDEQSRLMSLFKHSAPDFYTFANRRRAG